MAMTQLHANLEQASVFRICTQALVYLVAAWLLYLVIFNLFYHPLAPVPGPWIAKISGLYLVPAMATLQRSQVRLFLDSIIAFDGSPFRSIFALMKRGRQKLLKLHKQYGPVVRVGPNEVSISDPSALREIYNNKTTSKSQSMYGAAKFVGLHDNVFSMRNKEAHYARRKLENPSYSQQAVLQNEQLINDKAGILLQRMVEATKSSKSGKTVDVFTLNGLFSLEVILKVALNRNYGVSPDGDSLDLLTAMDGSGAAFATRVALPFIDRKWGVILPGFWGASFRQYNSFITKTRELQDQFVREELRGDADTKRFIATSLLNNHDAFLDRPLTQDEVHEELVGLVFAGSGTTSTVLTYLLWRLAKEPQRQEMLYKELQGAELSLGRLQQLPFLNAVIKETHRLHPSLMGMLPRDLDQAMPVGKFMLPKNAQIAMQNFVHQQDAEVFPDPQGWLPERWLHETTTMTSTLTPFSVGPRNCIGQNLAKAELLLATSKILKRFKLHLNAEMTDADMEMEDRVNTLPRGRRLLLDLEARD